MHIQKPRADTGCRRCRQPYSTHAGAALKCPTGETTWLGHVNKGDGTSFSESEIVWLDTVLATMRRGGDIRVLARSKDLKAVAHKVHVMNEAIARGKANK